MGMRRGFAPDSERRPFDRRLVGRLLRFMAPYRRHILLSGAALLLVSAAGLLQPLILRRALDRHVVEGDLEGLALLSLLYLLTYAITWGGGYLQAVWSAWAGQRALFDLRTKLFSHLEGQSLSFFDRRKAGELMSRVINDINSMADLISSAFVLFVNDLLLLVGIVAITFSLDWALALVTLGVLPLMWLSMQRFHTRLLRAFRLVRKKTGEVNATLQETISGVRDIQAYRRERTAMQSFSKVNEEQTEAQVKAINVWAVFMPVMEMVGTFGMVAVLFYGGLRVSKGLVTIGTLVAFLAYFERFMQPIRTLTQVYNQLQSAMAASERIFEILDSNPDVTDVPDAVDVPPLQEAICFDGVTFEYERGEPVLKDVDLVIPKGNRVALVGPTGAGKTSIVNLICRFYDPQEGAVTVDGIDLRRASLASWRRQIALVPQDTFLFSATVAENIRFGRPDATMEEVREAAEVVGAHAFIERLPDGYETRVNERGARLSVGQRQLISFARALLRRPELLILDEATAHIDSHSEARVQEALFRLIQGRTAVIIAHRLSTIRSCDVIFVVDEGRIVERGTHDELVALGGTYASLLRSADGPVERSRGASAEPDKLGPPTPADRQG